MIRKAGPGDEKLVLAAAQAAVGLGPRLAVDWALLRQNLAMPYLFYIVNETAVLEQTGRRATVCGPVTDGEELRHFIELCGLERVTAASGWQPPNWWSVSLYCMVWQGGGPPAPTAWTDGLTLEENPPVAEVMEVLQSSQQMAPEDRDGFYADLCTRLNHGFALVYGLRQSGRLVATAGVYCLTEAEAYIACVETRPSQRGRGLAAGLVTLLCHRFCEKRISLLCDGALCAYYEKLGFAHTGLPVRLALRRANG